MGDMAEGGTRMIEIHARVRYKTGTYIASGGGLRASCSAGPRMAIERLAEKLAARFDVPIYADIDWITGCEWQVLLDDREHLFAFCWQNGVIEFGEAVPEGALHVLDGTPFEVRDTIEATARLAHDVTTWLVPGVPEASDGKARVKALMDYRRWLIERLSVEGVA
ncbi:hypothetical protein [Methyloversatilis sp. XJ19-13]|uniref:hypothetical protein n=1 Tax=Methyloversatilis sp. XJ19-13 TaxID=2963430 RepID=UPI00211CE7EC|nr:hypothetical protein [Methyloversatilis sp. XJ19-13]